MPLQGEPKRVQIVEIRATIHAYRPGPQLEGYRVPRSASRGKEAVLCPKTMKLPEFVICPKCKSHMRWAKRDKWYCLNPDGTEHHKLCDELQVWNERLKKDSKLRKMNGKRKRK